LRLFVIATPRYSRFAANTTVSLATRAIPVVFDPESAHRIAAQEHTPESAEVFAENAYALLPHVKITELLAEVDHWTNLDDQFLHLRNQASPKNRQPLLTAALADGIKLTR
jgi:hypothetical protein